MRAEIAWCSYMQTSTVRAAPAKEVGFLDVCRRVAVSTEALLVVSAARAPRHLLLRQIADAAVTVRRVLTMEMMRPGRRPPALVTSVCANVTNSFLFAIQLLRLYQNQRFT